ncbi:acid phosphatase/Vanadium-dependent haloperoxidase [Backusella circina FSU 941]|nr:acid phosphatase/Vanadium-dependent haloperoxidase [Backusella circina FSU 941]
MFLGIDLKDKRNRLLAISYAKDWILVAIMLAVFFAIDTIHPFHREFSITDTTLMHLYATQESVPVWLLAVIAVVIPILIIASISLGYRRSWYDFHSGLLGLALALSLTCMMTDVIKITVGRPRPDMFDRCKPPPGIVDPPLRLLNYTICTEPFDTYEFKDGFKSFPSGHSSFSFAGLGYLAFFLAGKMHMFDGGGHTYKSFIFSIPFLGALLIAISRVRDYRHHWQDVFIGGIIGVVFSYFAYRQYYPSLAAVKSQKPHSPRIKKIEDIFPSDNRVPDIEAGRAQRENGEAGRSESINSNSVLM